MRKIKLNSTSAISTAIELGFQVYWSNDGYEVTEDSTCFLGYGVLCTANDYYTPLTYNDLDSVYTYELSV